MASDLIDSTEMYLRTVLELEEEGIPALRARLTDRLGLAAPSVSEGVARLERDGLLLLAEDRTVHLTDEGRTKAQAVMRKHRLAERLLADVLGVEDEFVHEEACRWEHVISDHVEQKIIAFLGSPELSPYGNPIPGLHRDETQPLPAIGAVEDGRYLIARISERLQSDHELMHRLSERGLVPGTEVDVARTASGVTVTMDGDVVDLSADTASFLYVRPAA